MSKHLRSIDIIVVVLLIGSFTMLSFGQRQIHNATVLNRATNHVLCQRAAIIDDLITGGIAVVTAERMDPNVPAGTHRADDIFIASFKHDKAVLAKQTTSPDSPCVKIAKQDGGR